MAKRMRCRPSALFGIDDTYTAYCFDEACIYIDRKIEAGNEPAFEKRYSSFKELYAQYGV